MKIFIGVPSARDWKCASAVTFAMAYAELRERIGADNILIHNQFACPNLADARERMAQEVLEGDWTHLLFFDDDMKIATDAFTKLLDHDKMVVGIDYSKKAIQPYSTTACSTKEGGHKRFHNMSGVQAAGNMGFGCVLIKREALEVLDAPMFRPRWCEKTLRHTTEDTPFFEQLLKKGVQPYVDLDLSKSCAHIGDYEYSIVDVPVDSKQVDRSGKEVANYDKIPEIEESKDA